MKSFLYLFRVFFFMVFSMLFCRVSATNYYVNTKGSDTAKGTQTAPFLTITHAAQVARGGDTVFVAGGIYSEMNIKPANSGSVSGGHIVFHAQQQTGKVRICKANNSIADANTPVFDLSGRSYIWIEGFEFADMIYLSSCVRTSGSAHCVVSGCQFRNLGHENVSEWGATAMVWLHNSTDCIVRNCFFSDIYGDAIDFTGQQSKRHLVCENSFTGMKGKKRNWASEKYRYSSAITCSDTSFGNSLILLNHIEGGQDGIWLDRDASRNIVTRNWGDGGQRLVFNESRCAYNWIQENVACNMTEQGYQSARYDDTGWSSDTRWLHNVAFRCKTGFFMHKSKHNEVRGNIAYDCSDYSLVFTDSAVKYGTNEFSSNLWYAPSKTNTMLYRGRAISTKVFATRAGEMGGIYGKEPQFVSIVKPYDFALQSGSPCVGTGDEGVDVGAYPVYPFYPMGCDTTHVNSNVQVWFEDVVTEAVRGESYPIKLRLAKASQETVGVVVTPIAGDVRQGKDFELDASSVTFLPGETTKEIHITFLGEERIHNQLLVLKLSAASDELSFDARSFMAFKLITKSDYELQQSSDIWLEAEGGSTGSLWATYNDSRASDGKYIMVKPGNNSNDNAPTTERGWCSYTFDIKFASTYVLWMRTICPSANDDSFWLRMDDGDWSYWNGIPASTSWQWNQSSKTFALGEGTHTIYVGYREDGAKLDKLLLSCSGTVPEGVGKDVSAIEIPKVSVYPVSTYYFDLHGRQVDSNTQGIVIVRQLMSDGTIRSMKQWRP